MNIAELHLSERVEPAPVPSAAVAAEVPLAEKVSIATVEWIRALKESEEQGRNEFLKDNQLIRRGIWYSAQHRKTAALLGQKAAKVKEYVEKRNGYVCVLVDPKYFTTMAGNKARNDYYSFNGQRVLHFRLKDGVLPSDAIRAARAGLSIIDCGVACQIARYGALLEVLGERKFNILFGHSAKGQKMNIGYITDDELQPMKHFVNFTEATIESMVRMQMERSPEKIVGEIGNRPVQVGQLAEVRGVSAYHLKHPWGAEAGYNVICSDDTPGQQRFVGLGIEGSEAEMNAYLVTEYNKDFDFDNLLPELRNPQNKADAAHYKEDKVKSLDPRKGEGFNPGSIQDFHLSLIADLIALPENEVSMEYVRRHPSQNEDALRRRIIFAVVQEKQ